MREPVRDMTWHRFLRKGALEFGALKGTAEGRRSVVARSWLASVAHRRQLRVTAPGVSGWLGLARPAIVNAITSH